MDKRTVLITGCSDGGLGTALALEFQARGCRVIATARNPAKMQEVKAAGIETVTLDIMSTASIDASVLKVRELLGGSLDILVNNAAGTYYAPVADTNIEEAKAQFDVNVWAHLAVTQAYLGLLCRSKHGGIIVNHTSVSSAVNTPFTSIYGASKAALAMITRGLDTELRAFGIRAIDVKSGVVTSNICANEGARRERETPRQSMYHAGREYLDTFMTGDSLNASTVPSGPWAKRVVGQVLAPSPPKAIWEGAFNWLIWFLTFMPYSVQDMVGRSTSQCDAVDKAIKEYGVDKAIADRYGTA